MVGTNHTKEPKAKHGCRGPSSQTGATRTHINPYPPHTKTKQMDDNDDWRQFLIVSDKACKKYKVDRLTKNRQSAARSRMRHMCKLEAACRCAHHLEVGFDKVMHLVQTTESGDASSLHKAIMEIKKATEVAIEDDKTQASIKLDIIFSKISRGETSGIAYQLPPDANTRTKLREAILARQNR